jgi:hypothetical protein
VKSKLFFFNTPENMKLDRQWSEFIAKHCGNTRTKSPMKDWLPAHYREKDLTEKK